MHSALQKKEILTAVIIYTVTENREGGWVNQNSSFKSSKMTAITALQLRKKHVQETTIQLIAFVPATPEINGQKPRSQDVAERTCDERMTKDQRKFSQENLASRGYTTRNVITKSGMEAHGHSKISQLKKCDTTCKT